MYVPFLCLNTISQLKVKQTSNEWRHIFSTYLSLTYFCSVFIRCVFFYFFFLKRRQTQSDVNLKLKISKNLDLIFVGLL